MNCRIESGTNALPLRSAPCLRAATTPSPSPNARARRRRARRWSPRIFSAARPCSCSARRRCCWSSRKATRGASPCTAARSLPRRPTERASSAAATTAKWSRPMPQAKAERSPPTRSGAGSITSRSGPDGAVAWSAGKTAFAQSQGVARIRGALDRRRPRLSAERLSARGRALQRRDAVVSECAAGGAGNARMEGLASRRDSQSRRPLSGHDDAGADAARLAPRRPQAHAHVRLCGAGDLAWLDGRRRLARDLRRAAAHPLAVPDAKTARWARSRAYWRRQSTASRSSPATRSGTSSPPATPTAWCSSRASRTAPRSWPKIRARRPVSALAWSADGMLLAFGTEDGEAGVIDLA